MRLLLLLREKSKLPTEMPKGRTQDERRHERRDNYLAENARYLYFHTPRLKASTNSSTSTGKSSTSPEMLNECSQKVCKNCAAVLSHYVVMFKGLYHQGSTLKKCKHRSPNLEYYRNLKLQNEWLRVNMFDPIYRKLSLLC